MWNYNKYSAKLKRRLFLFRHAKWKHDMLLKCFTWQYVLNTINMLSTFIYSTYFLHERKEMVVMCMHIETKIFPSHVKAWYLWQNCFPKFLCALTSQLKAESISFSSHLYSFLVFMIHKFKCCGIQMCKFNGSSFPFPPLPLGLPCLSFQNKNRFSCTSFFFIWFFSFYHYKKSNPLSKSFRNIITKHILNQTDDLRFYYARGM